jgi:exodeoxyribonuclease VII large subunit
VQRFDDLKRRLVTQPLRGLPEKRLKVAALARRLIMALPVYPARARARLQALGQRLERRSPLTRLHVYRVRLTLLPGRLSAAVRAALRAQETRLTRLNERLRAHPPDRLWERLAGRHGLLKDRLERAMQNALKARAERVALLNRALALTGPPGVLNRGYAIVTDTQGHVAREARAYPPGTTLRVRLAQGEIIVEVKATQP